MRKKIIGLMVAFMAGLVLLGCSNPTDSNHDNTISILAIAGVTAPAVGVTPVTAIPETAQYTGTISWSPTVNGSYTASTVYTATITLTAKSGYTLTGVAANGFTVAGATATNSADSGVVTAVFPATGDGIYTSVNIGTLNYVPAGTFQRDATAGNTSTVSAFRMSKCEITRSQFQAIMGTDPSDTVYSIGTTDPVQQTNWYHAIAFCNKLSIAEGLTPVYGVTVSGTAVNWSTLTYADIPTASNTDWDAAVATWTNNGYRLPTEMEWMWAAMGATGMGTNAAGYLKGYAGSTEGPGQTNIGNYAWYGTNSASKTHPAGTKTANELGLYDMSGNVLEWNWDWHDAYPTGAVTDYRGAASGTYRVHRGGGWINDASTCTVASRGYSKGGYRLTNVGFRVVRN